jgi:hypothetical protein
MAIKTRWTRTPGQYYCFGLPSSASYHICALDACRRLYWLDGNCRILQHRESPPRLFSHPGNVTVGNASVYLVEGQENVRPAASTGRDATRTFVRKLHIARQLQFG